MPPQEGVNLKDTFEQALRRCLQVECGINMPINQNQQSKKLHLRSIRYVGDVTLPANRKGERPIADDVHGTWLESIKLRKKAYWMATLIVSEKSDAQPKADGKELINLEWYSLEDARRVVTDTNHKEKAKLILKILEFCKSDMLGGPIERLAKPPSGDA
jgi:hypothetical protein